MEPTFVAFGPAHLIVMALTLVIPALLVAWVKTARSEKLASRVAITLAIILLINEALAFGWKWHIGTLTWQNNLPMHLCDWATFTVAATCFWRRQLAYELSYFWGLAGTLQAIVTPNLQLGFPTVNFIVFFLSHCGIVAAILYLTFAFPLRPTWRSIGRAYGWLLFYAACAGLVDWVTGANYGFLRAKPLGASLLDFFGPWPWYIPVTTLLALAFFVLYYLPFAVADWVKARKNRTSINESTNAVTPS